MWYCRHTVGLVNFQLNVIISDMNTFFTSNLSNMAVWSEILNFKLWHSTNTSISANSLHWDLGFWQLFYLWTVARLLALAMCTAFVTVAPTVKSQCLSMELTPAMCPPGIWLILWSASITFVQLYSVVEITVALSDKCF